MRGRWRFPSRYMRTFLKNKFYYACLIKEIVCTILVQLMFRRRWFSYTKS
jgi:hypothetical protein